MRVRTLKGFLLFNLFDYNSTVGTDHFTDIASYAALFIFGLDRRRAVHPQFIRPYQYCIGTFFFAQAAAFAVIREYMKYCLLQGEGYWLQFFTHITTPLPSGTLQPFFYPVPGP